MCLISYWLGYTMSGLIVIFISGYTVYSPDSQNSKIQYARKKEPSWGIAPGEVQVKSFLLSESVLGVRGQSCKLNAPLQLTLHQLHTNGENA